MRDLAIDPGKSLETDLIAKRAGQDQEIRGVVSRGEEAGHETIGGGAGLVKEADQGQERGAGRGKEGQAQGTRGVVGRGEEASQGQETSADQETRGVGVGRGKECRERGAGQIGMKAKVWVMW